MPGFMPGIHVFGLSARKTWMAGTSPAMTAESSFDSEIIAISPAPKTGEGSAALATDPSVRQRQPACKPGSVGRRCLRRRRVTAIPLGRRLRAASSNLPERRRLDLPRGVIACANPPLCRSYSVLLPVGFAMPPPLLETRCALTAPFHPYRVRGRGGPFSVALSLKQPRSRAAAPPDVIRHRLSMEPGLSSHAAFRRLRARPSGRLTRV